MVDFQGLTNAQPELLAKVAQTFSQWSDTLDQHAVSLRDRIINQITQPTVWQGDAANAAGRHCDNLRLTAFKTVDEMREIGPVLTEAADEIASAKQSLQTAVTQAQSLGFTVGADGTITVPPMENVPAGQEKAAQDAMNRKQESANALAQQIHDAIMKASDADVRAATALLENSPDLQDVDKVGDQMRDMEAKGKRAAELAGRGWLSNEERQELLNLLKANSHDPTFATAMLRDLGPQGTLYFGGYLAKLGGPNDDKEIADQIRQMQTEMGHVLATGTNPRMEPHVEAAWVNELTKAGREKIDVGLYSYHPYGYQLLGAMMHSGSYSPEFLNKVGNDMLAFERQQPGVWVQNLPSGAIYNGFKLNYIDDQGAGFDPMGGLMRAMTQNPEAATQFFDPAQHPDTVKYMINRFAMPDMPMGQIIPEDYQAPYRSYFGDALEAATLHGDRDARAAAIATETINDFGTRDDKGKLPPMPDNLKDSVGRIISGYIGDVNDAVSNNPVRSSTWDDPAIPGGNEHHAVFDKKTLLAAMGEAAKDPDAYVEMYNAERAYSALAFDHAVGDTGSTLDGRASLLEQSAKQSTEVFGALDDARAEAIRHGHEEADKAYNEAIERNGKVANFILGELAGKVPVVGDGIQSGAESYIDALVENSKHDSSGLSTKEMAELYGNGRHQAAQLAVESMWQHKMWPPDHPPPAILFPNGPGGEPVPITHMSEQQRQEFVTWAKSSGYAQYIGRVTGEIDDSYSVGEDLNREQRGDR